MGKKNKKHKKKKRKKERKKERKKKLERSFWKRRTMHLMYHLDAEGKRVYTLKKADPNGKQTVSAHPARFSPDDKFSKHRITTKRRFGLLPTQQPRESM